MDKSIYTSMEKNIETLTHEISKKCAGKGAAVVIGANLNMIMTAAQMIPDKAIREGLAMSFRNIADSLEKQSGVKQ